MNTVYGRFITELKNRFRCIVNVENEMLTCYVPTSCRLENFGDFNNCITLLKENKKTQSALKYQLYAIKYQNDYILLDLKEANRIVERSLKTNTFDWLGTRKKIKSEVSVKDYRMDFYIEDTDAVVEVKSIISCCENSEVIIVPSERNLKQLKVISSMLEKNQKVYYILLSMFTGTKKLYLKNSEDAFYKALKENIDNGMVCKAFSIVIDGADFKIGREIPFEFID